MLSRLPVTLAQLNAGNNSDFVPIKKSYKTNL